MPPLRSVSFHLSSGALAQTPKDNRLTLPVYVIDGIERPSEN
jgi:hypothetical protein